MIQLAIKGGRHPILENVQAVGSFVANDAYACDSSTFQIVQGPKYVLSLRLMNHARVLLISQRL